MKPLALYIHIPFCWSKCIYCDFASYPNSEDRIEPYLAALKEELCSWKCALQGYELTSIFIGGGTPSILSGQQIEDLLRAVRRTIPVRSDAEITMEANPGTVNLRKLQICRRSGVNRISFGAQSMNDGLLKKLGRIHTAAEIREAVSMAREAGFNHVSLDLMYALPGQTTELWRDTLDQAIALNPDHISAYSLIVEEGTPMYDLAESGKVDLPDDDSVIKMQHIAIDRLADAGYHRYEISNYARPGCECRHNIVYWQRGEYLGVGCAAHSLMNGERFENPRSLSEYLAGARRCDRIALTREDEMEETLMLATRMTQGMNLDDYRSRFGVDFATVHQESLRRLQALGLIEIDSGFLRLTRRGLEVQNAVVVELLEEE